MRRPDCGLIRTQLVIRGEVIINDKSCRRGFGLRPNLVIVLNLQNTWYGRCNFCFGVFFANVLSCFV